MRGHVAASTLTLEVKPSEQSSERSSTMGVTKDANAPRQGGTVVPGAATPTRSAPANS